MTYPYGGPMMIGGTPFSYVGFTLDPGNPAAGTFNVLLPSGSAVGDLALALGSYNGAVPAGFTQIRRSTMANNGGQWVQSGYKILAPSDIANGYITFPTNGTSNVLLVYRGVTQAAHTGEFEPAATSGVNAVTYVANANAVATVAFCCDRDGNVAGITVTNATACAANPNGTGNYAFTVAHNLTPIANGTVITFNNLLSTAGQIAAIIDLI